MFSIIVRAVRGSRVQDPTGVLPRQRRGVRFLAAIALCLLGALLPQSARADDTGGGFYVAGKGGPTFATVRDVNSGSGTALADDKGNNLIGGFGMAAGYTWAKQGLPLRTELEFMNRTEVSFNASPLLRTGAANGAIASDVQNVTLMAKGYYHFSVGAPLWSPFVSAGLGISRNAVKGQFTPFGGGRVKIDSSEYDLAWSAGVGASFYLGNHIVNDIELSYADLGEPDWGQFGNQSLTADRFAAVQILFDLRFNF